MTTPHGLVKILKDKNGLLKPKRRITLGNSDTEVLIIGCSNLKKYVPSQIPSHWSVVSIPGANTQLINDLLVKSTPSSLPKLKHIIIAVGINDRDNDFETPIMQCLASAKAYIGTNGLTHFQGIPINRHVLSSKQITNLELINTNAAKLLKEHYIPPPNLVRTTSDGVHYLQETLNQIIKSMITTVNHLN